MEGHRVRLFDVTPTLKLVRQLEGKVNPIPDCERIEDHREESLIQIRELISTAKNNPKKDRSRCTLQLLFDFEL